MYQILEKRRLSANASPAGHRCTLRCKEGRAWTVHHPPRRRGRRAHPADHLGSTTARKGTITIVVQEVGATTMKLGHDERRRLPARLSSARSARLLSSRAIKRAAVVGGGLGCAIALSAGTEAARAWAVDVDLIAGFRNTDAIILEDEMTGRMFHRSVRW